MIGGLVATDHIHERVQGQCSGWCRSSLRLVLAIRAGTLMSFSRRVAQRAVRMLAAAAAAVGDVERDHCTADPGGVGRVLPGR